MFTAIRPMSTTLHTRVVIPSHHTFSQTKTAQKINEVRNKIPLQLSADFNSLIQRSDASFTNGNYSEAKQFALDALKVYAAQTKDPVLSANIEQLELCEKGATGMLPGF